jgi:EAL domain-containing protein (putative c-di-GMP-specific phosphodiesterase class I)
MIRLPLNYTMELEKNKDKIDLVDSICTITNILGIDVFVEAVNEEEDYVILKKFGIKGIGNNSNIIKKDK